MSKYYAYETNETEAHVYIFGDIVPFAYFEGDTSADSFRREISALDVQTIHVHIDSYGGAVSEGWALYNTLKEHPAKIITHGDGFVASAALYPFMAGDERILSNLSALFFHQVLVEVYGNADTLRAAAEEAEKINQIGLAAFTSAGIDAETVLQLEKAETWVSPTEALELGLATAIKATDNARQSQSIKRDVMQRMLASAPTAPEAPVVPPVEEPTVNQQTEEVNTIMRLISGMKGD